MVRVSDWVVVGVGVTFGIRGAVGVGFRLGVRVVFGVRVLFVCVCVKQKQANLFLMLGFVCD